MKINHLNPIVSSLPYVFDQFVNNFFDEPSLKKSIHSQLPVNIQESDTEFSLDVYVPGFAKDNIHIKLEKNILEISAKSSKTDTETNAKYIRNEFIVRDISRKFTISESIDTNNISATYNNGILCVHLPKQKQTEALVKSISIS